MCSASNIIEYCLSTVYKVFFHNFWKCRPCMYRIVIKMSSFSSLIIARAILKENIVLLLLLYLWKIQPLKKKKF
jgi:hypothetical protein